MTRLTFFEPLIDGHCTFWARMILTMASHDPRVTELRFVTSSAMLSRLAPYLSDLAIETETIAPERLAEMTSGSLLRRGRAQWMAARHLARDSAVFLPFFDHAVVAAAIDPVPIARGGRVSGVIFRPPNSHGLPYTAKSRLDAVRRWTTYALARRVTRGPLFTLDELVAAKKGVGQSSAFVFLPDPAPDMAMLKGVDPRTRDDGRSVALVFGALTRRKGIFQTLDAWHHLAPSDRGRLALRFVGRLDDAERAPFLESLAIKRAAMPDAVIELQDRFVTDEDLAAEILGADIILAPYQNHIGSSGVMHWAVAAGKPLIAQKTGLIGYQVDRYHLGAATDCSDPKKISSAIMDAAGQRNAASAAFATQHTPANFVRTILDEMI